MPDRDTALIIAALGLPQHLIEVHHDGIEIEIQVQIDIDIEACARSNSFSSAPSDRFHYGQPPIRSAASRRAATRSCSYRDRWEPSLREDADRKIDRPRRSPRLSILIASKAAQSDARIHLNMGRIRRGAVNDGALEHAAPRA